VADTSDNQCLTATTGKESNVILSASRFLAAKRMFHKGFVSSRPTLDRCGRLDPIKTNFWQRVMALIAASRFSARLLLR
jgi:hypothetical protein